MDNSVQATIHANDQVIWSAAALVLALRPGTPADLHDTAVTVLESLGIDPTVDDTGRDALTALASAALLQASALLRGEQSSWADQSDQALLAQD
jgi:hypothetical protein